MSFFPPDLTSYGFGSNPLQGSNQFVFGNDNQQYIFPLTFQEADRNLKLGVSKQRIPFGWGDHIPPNTNVQARDVNLVGSVGSLIYGSGGNQLINYNDLEAERSILAGLQALGRQKLWGRPDRYLLAYLIEFDFKFQQDGGLFRYADWNLKFQADDPRYYSKTVHTFTQNNINNTTAQSYAATQSGNVKSYPIFTLTTNAGANTGPSPFVLVTIGGKTLKVTFSKLTMQGSETLVVRCDPRPENRLIGAVYTNASGQQLNAMQYINGAGDLINTLDFTEFFPFIPPSGGQLGFGCATGSPNYNMTLSFQDMWI